MQIELKKEDELLRESMLFKPSNFFMVRAPLLPMDFYENLYYSPEGSIRTIDDVSSRIFQLSKDPYIKEAIMVSSGSLYDSINNWKYGDDKTKDKKVIQALNKYLIRMSSRPTPFGLFSGITNGEYSDKTSLTLDTTYNHKKRARPDMAWILSLVHKLESDMMVLNQIKIHTNSIIIDCGGRYKLPYNSQCGKNTNVNSTEVVSINKTPVVELIFDLCKEPINFSDVVKEVKSSYSSALDEQIMGILQQLIDKEYLLSELRPPLTSVSPFSYLLKKVSLIDGLGKLNEQLSDVRSKIENYNNRKIGEGLSYLQSIQEQMNSIVESKNFLQVDTKLNGDSFRINQEIGLEAARVAEILWKTSVNTNSLTHIQQYRNEFIEKYGIYREVPLLELLDEDSGLGAPASYMNPVSAREVENVQNADLEKREKFMLRKLVETLNSESMEMVLTNQDLKELESNHNDMGSVPSSLEIYGTLVSGSQEQVDQGDYRFVMGISGGSDGAGKTFGRFLDILDEEKFNEKFSSIYDQEEKDKAIYAELVYLPTIGRTANVTLTKNYRDYEIVIGTNSSKESNYTIDLSDIIVGSSMDKFYLKSKSLGKRLSIRVTNMLNQNSAPNVYRFLSEVSNDGIKPWSPFMWYSLDSSPFLPRVRFNKSVLSLAKWNLNNQTLPVGRDIDNLEKWKRIFYEWAEKWRLPRLVYQTIGDNRILLDIYNEMHIEELYMQFKGLPQGETLTLFEKESGTLTNWEKDIDGNSYNVEYAFPIILKDGPDRMPKPLMKEPLNLEPINSNGELAKKLPGSDWIYLKIYGNSTREDDLIAFFIKEFCESVKEEGIIEKYFFMRYADPGKHIRLRFNGRQELISAKLLPRLYQWFSLLEKEGLITSVDISTYDREVERYGGPKLIDLAETLFYRDSQCVELLLGKQRLKETSFSLDIVATLSVLHYLQHFGLSFRQQLEWFNSIVPHKDYIEEFREHRKLLMSLHHKGSNNEQENIDFHDLSAILDTRNDSVHDFIKKMNHLSHSHALYNSVEDILGSIIHLHLNRLLGIDRKRESKIMAYVRHTLYNLRYLKEGIK